MPSADGLGSALGVALPYLGRDLSGSNHCWEKQRFDGFVTNGIARNEKTTVGIVHQIGAFWA